MVAKARQLAPAAVTPAIMAAIHAGLAGIKPNLLINIFDNGVAEVISDAQAPQLFLDVVDLNGVWRHVSFLERTFHLLKASENRNLPPLSANRFQSRAGWQNEIWKSFGNVEIIHVCRPSHPGYLESLVEQLIVAMTAEPGHVARDLLSGGSVTAPLASAADLLTNVLDGGLNRGGFSSVCVDPEIAKFLLYLNDHRKLRFARQIVASTNIALELVQTNFNLIDPAKAFFAKRMFHAGPDIVPFHNDTHCYHLLNLPFCIRTASPEEGTYCACNSSIISAGSMSSHADSASSSPPGSSLPRRIV